MVKDDLNCFRPVVDNAEKSKRGKGVKEDVSCISV